ncbi:MAG: hypothetical protein JJE28_07570 [Actinomycetales bacterium]|nr:hypothetical protein [Actinomycetales bacterium]
MPVFADVEAELDRLEVAGWQRSVALALASALDEKANASMASELRSLMGSVGSKTAAKPVPKVNDDLREQREKRRVESRSAKSS